MLYGNFHTIGRYVSLNMMLYEPLDSSSYPYSYPSRQPCISTSPARLRKKQAFFHLLSRLLVTVTSNRWSPIPLSRKSSISQPRTTRRNVKTENAGRSLSGQVTWRDWPPCPRRSFISMAPMGIYPEALVLAFKAEGSALLDTLWV